LISAADWKYWIASAACLVEGHLTLTHDAPVHVVPKVEAAAAEKTP
jgi:hypothetical protein